MFAFRYYCLKHNPSPENLPVGYVGSRVWGSRPYIPAVGCRVYGTVDYKTPLSYSLASKYDLVPASMVQQPLEIEA